MKHRAVSFMSALLVALLILQTSVFAFDFNGSQGNKATFETLEETRESSPEAVANLETNVGRTFMSHPVLDGYPEGTTYVYRSPELYGGRAGARLNTNILVFAEQAFKDKDEAFKYLESLGLIDIINEATGSVVLVTPANPETGFSAADQKNYYKLQTAMLAQKASQTVGQTTTYYSDAEYFGGYGYLYVIGIDGGATFLNNYVSGVFDYVSRIAGMLLINGDMADISQIATFVPTYLVNAKESIINKYKAANTVDAYRLEGELETFYNQAFPLRQVRVLNDAGADVADCINDAYYDMFIKAMRLPIVKQGLHSASSPYQGYNFDEAPYSLCERNPVINGVTADGIHVIRHDEDLFPDIQTANGDTFKTWFEFLPEEVLNGTAPEGTVPLILGMHGSGDDPRLFVDELGWLSLMGKERFVFVAPEHQYLGQVRKDGEVIQGILSDVLPMFIDYLLETYPALDASRVYVTGYSMGGGATLRAISGDAASFAAAVPMAAVYYDITPEQAKQYETVDLPIMLTTSTYDLAIFFDQVNGTLSTNLQTLVTQYTGFNGLTPIKTFDFEKYPYVGFKADYYNRIVLNGEYGNHTWFLNNDKGVPMVGVNVTEYLIHGLYPEYAKLAWDFMKQYSRDQETGEIIYNPYAK